MTFDFGGVLTKDMLLNKYSEETFMEYYLGFPVDKKLHTSPLRDDHNPTCSFFRTTNGTLLFHDFGDGSYRDFVKVVMDKYGASYHKALRIIANDFNIVPDASYEKNSGIVNYPLRPFTNGSSARIQVEIRDFTDGDIAWWKQFGISKKTLQFYRVYSCKTVFLDSVPYTISGEQKVFGYFGGIDNGKELWRIYYPENRTHRFLTNWSSRKIQGWEQLSSSGKLVVITKSMKDVMLLHELGIDACAPNSEMLFLTEEQLANLKSRFKYLVVLYDNDLPGIASMNRLKKKHPELLYTWIPRDKAKDLSDLYRDFGRDVVISLIKKFIQKLSCLRINH